MIKVMSNELKKRKLPIEADIPEDISKHPISMEKVEKLADLIGGQNEPHVSTAYSLAKSTREFIELNGESLQMALDDLEGRSSSY